MLHIRIKWDLWSASLHAIVPLLSKSFRLKFYIWCLIHCIPEVPVNLSFGVFTAIVTSLWLGNISLEWNSEKFGHTTWFVQKIALTILMKTIMRTYLVKMIHIWRSRQALQEAIWSNFPHLSFSIELVINLQITDI